MTLRNRVCHQIWAHLGKVASVTLVNPRNQQKWVFQDLVMQIHSPWCTTWCSVIIWGFEHAHKSWRQGEEVGSTNLFKFGSGQRGFWGILVNQNDFNWLEALQGDHNMHLWLVGFSLDFYENISCRNISNPWNGQKWFWEVLSNILIMTICWNSYIWEIYAHWVSLIFVKYFWINKIIFPN